MSASMVDHDSAAHQLVGAVFNGRWRLHRLVGEGGMGAVYESHGLHNEGVRAIKVLHPEFVSEEQILGRFIAEAQAVRQLQHPNIAQIFDQGRAEDGTPYLVMEFLQGAPLSNFMHGKPMPTQQAAGIMLGVLQALATAHRQGIVHRDLKPDNLFLVNDGRGNYVVKVLDFGIAKVMDAAGGMGSKTKTGVLLGTPGYMSPEQIKNSKGVDARSDLWSCGIIFYEMLTGREAFPAENEFTRLTLVLTQDIKPIGEVIPQLANWTSFFQRALSKEIAHRFQSAQEMGQALAAMMSGGGSSQGKDGGTVAISLPLGGYQAGPATHGSPQAMRTPHGHQQQHPQSMHQPQAHSVHGGGHGAGGYQQQGNRPSAPPGYVSTGSVPPPAPIRQSQNPSTHVSAQRPPGVPTLSQGSRSPAVEMLAPPPVGAPWWVVAAVGGACLVVGFIVGYLVK